MGTRILYSDKSRRNTAVDCSGRVRAEAAREATRLHRRKKTDVGPKTPGNEGGNGKTGVRGGVTKKSGDRTSGNGSFVINYDERQELGCVRAEAAKDSGRSPRAAMMKRTLRVPNRSDLVC
ncbi:hypothetical protein MRX96_024401 [Rhipicephalus microplus]